MEKSIQIFTEAALWFSMALLSFILGFHFSYKSQHVFNLLEFLYSCYTWTFQWLNLKSNHLSPSWQMMDINSVDGIVTAAFFLFVSIFASILLLETVRVAARSLLRSNKRS